MILQTDQMEWKYFGILSITILLLYRFFYYVNFSSFNTLMGYGALATYIWMFIYGVRYLNSRLYRTESFLILLCIITFFVSILLYSQSLSIISRYLIPLSFIPYLYCVKSKIGEKTVEKVLLFIGLLYYVCWQYQVISFPNLAFGTRELSEETTRGFARFYIATKEHFPFLLFFFLAKYNETKKIIYSALAICVFACIILHVGRQMIVWSGLTALVFILYTNSKRIKNIIIISIICYFAMTLFIENFSVVSDLIDLTQNSEGGINSADTDNIRIEAMGKFISDFNDNLITTLFGNGYAVEGTGLYSKYLRYENNGYYISDVGFVGMFINQGLIYTVLLVILLYQTLFRYKVSDRYLYLKYYIVYICLSYIGSHSLSSNLIFIALSIYIIKTNYIKNKNENTHCLQNSKQSCC